MDRKKTSKVVDICCLLLIFVLSFVVYYLGIVNTQKVYDSDYAYYALAGKEIMSGNIFLKGWYGATNTFYFLALIYGVIGKIFGYNFGLLYIVSAFMWAFFVVVVSLFTLKLNKNEKKYIKLLLVLALCYSSCYFTQEIKILGGVHLDALLLSMLFVWTISVNVEEEKITNRLLLGLSSMCLLLALFSDELVLYFIIVPLLIVCIWQYLFGNASREKRKIIIQNFVLTCGIAMLDKLIMKVLSSLGGIQVSWNASSITFIQGDTLFDRIEYFIEEMLYLFNANVYGKNVSINSLAVLMRFALLMICILVFVVSFSSIRKKTFNQILIVSVLIQSCILLFTTYLSVEDGVEYTSRVMYYTFVFLVVLFGQADFDRIMEVKINIPKHIAKVICIIILTLVLMVSISEINLTKKQSEDNKYLCAARILEERGLTQGYGTFWLSNVTTLASGCKVYVNPVCNGNDLSKFKWLSSSTDSWQYANFVLVDESNWDNVSRDTVIDVVGMPKEEIKVEDITIMIWDKNIMPYINHSGVEPSLDYWWDMDNEEKIKIIEVNNKHFYSVFEADENGEFISTSEGQLIYGPFHRLEAGTYDISFSYEYQGDKESGEVIGYVDAFSASDAIQYNKMNIFVGKKEVTLSDVIYGNDCTEAELRAYVNVPGIIIKQIKIEKKQ